ncbi:hypothetical protein PYW07_016997 [Mythimna separata]|uniref:Uncharacterized protein n=1 Tax=Mythimna separata TaxID=271217 RepID=A0AAD7YWW2_MYTSE|nr:hypothetical protein PYW07_016997 [Mythimna separata]
MTKRHSYPGYYLRTHPGKMPNKPHQASAAAPVTTIYRDWELLTKTAQSYIWTLYCTMSGNYIAVGTVVVVLILSFLLPDITQKMHAAADLKTMKKVLDKISVDVKRAEAACLTVADEISYLQRNMNDDTTETSKGKLQVSPDSASGSVRMTQSEPTKTEKKFGLPRRAFCPNRNGSNKEVTIMSYVYTDSFDDNKTEQEEQVVQE